MKIKLYSSTDEELLDSFAEIAKNMQVTILLPSPNIQCLVMITISILK